MKHRLSFLILFLLIFLCSSAQQHTITGTVINEHDKQPVELATVRLLTPDSVLVTGTFTDSIGNFTLHTDRKGNFIIYTTYVSFKPASKNVHLAQRDSIDVGVLKMMSDDIALRSAVVTATVARVEQVEDTTVFNASAYRTPDGATLEALIKQFPGIEVTDDGKIKWNGKEVKEFLINGKDFFKGDTDVAMKNMPVNLVRRVKAYDKRSDYAEQTGIDDGDETTVLDIMTKRELNQSLISNIDLAGGWDWSNHALYSGKVFVTRFTDQSRVTAFASRNNVGDAGFGGPRGMGGGGGGNGITTSTMAGFDFNWDNGIKRFAPGRLELGGNVNYRGRNNETESTSSSETFMTNSVNRSYSNSHSWGTSESHNVSSSFRFQWNPDSLTNISFRPSYNWSKNDNTNHSRSAQFDQDPFNNIAGAESTDDVLNHLNWIFYRPSGALSDEEQSKYTTDYSWLVNLNDRNSLSESQSHNVSANLNMTRRLTGKQGRNVSLQASGGWSKSEAWSYSSSNIYTRKKLSATPPDDTTPHYVLSPEGTHQFTLSPSKNWNASAGGSYVEPLCGKWYGELRYNFSHRFQDTNRSQYDILGRTPGETLRELIEDHDYTTFYQLRDDHVMDATQAFLSLNPNEVYAAMQDLNNSRYSTYRYDNHRASVGVRYNTQDINFNASLSLNPEHTTLHYERPGLLAQPIDTARSVFTVSPQVRFRYNFSKTNRLEIFYRGNSSQPSMTNLLPVVDTSNPLNISAGNPGLAPSWDDSFRFNFNGYNTERQAGTNVNLSFSNNRRGVTTRQITDETTGVRYSRPENINGNWSANGGVMFNVGLGREKLFTVSTTTNLSYRNNVGYSSARGKSNILEENYASKFDFMQALFEEMGTTRNKTQSTGVSENLNLAFRQTYWDISANGRMNYQHSVSNAMNARKMDTWGYAYGLTGNVRLDCGFALSTDIRMNSRRGYSEKTMNTNELIWNAQISQSLLKDKSLTLSLQFYDILQQQSNISRTVSALSRSDAWSDAINSYFMLHVIYKLNIFAGSHKKGNDSTAPANGRPEGGQRGGFGGERPGGYGGGRPERGGFGPGPGRNAF